MNRQNLSWYANRLRNMSVGEVSHRILENAKKKNVRRKNASWADYTASIETMPKLPGLREAVDRASQDCRNTVASDASRLLSGKFSALGQTWPQQASDNLYPQEIWSLDPVTASQWPNAKEFTFDISYRHERKLGDVKYVWEFNRLQFLQILAAHLYFSKSLHAKTAIETCIESWHEANPPYRGMAWNSGIEVALRAISLLIVTTLCGEDLSPATIRRVNEILNVSSDWLMRFPSRYSSANNHRIAECVGELLIHQSLSGLPHSEKRVARCRETLLTELKKQILPDGVGAEQSPTYAAFTIEFALLAELACRSSGAAFSSVELRAFPQFAEYISWLNCNSDQTPQIGDDDEGRVLSFHGTGANYPLEIARAAYGRSLPQAKPNQSTGLFATIFNSIGEPPIPQKGIKTFESGGYTVINDVEKRSSYTIIFDHGPLGYLSIAAHGHADALSLILTLNKEPILVDPGTYLYHSGGAWRGWFRGTAAHNTLNIDHQNQSIISGSFNWSSKAMATLESAVAGENWSVCASHDGYQKRYGVRHHRRISKCDDGIEIVDCLKAGICNSECEIVFQFAPFLTVQETSPNSYEVRKQTEKLATFVLPTQGTSYLLIGADIHDGGWVSQSFGTKQAAFRLVWRGTISEGGVVSRILF